MYKNTLSITIRIAQEQYYNQRLSETKGSIKMLWTQFGSVINPGKKKSHQINKLLVDGKMFTKPQDIADQFNEYFTHIGPDLAKAFPEKTKYAEYLGPSNEHSIYLIPTIPEEISKIMSELSGKKASGPDEVAPRIMKENHETLSVVLSDLINISFNTGTFPEQLKLGKVIPVYKKKEKFLPGNYRPISILNFFSKIFEKAMYKRLYGFLIQHNILYKYQFGFRQDHSTTLALIQILDEMHEYIDQGNFVVGTYIDLTKAFDTVDHQILLNKLSHYGVRGTAHSKAT